MTMTKKPRPPRRSRLPRVPQKELDKRTIMAVEYVHAAAVEAIGEDVDPRRLREALLWVFGYLTGGEQAHLTYAYERGNPPHVERCAGRAIAAGIQAYAGCLRAEGPPEHAWVADRLEQVAARTGWFGPKGPGHLELVRDPAPAPAEHEQPDEPQAEPHAEVDDDAIPF